MPVNEGGFIPIMIPHDQSKIFQASSTSVTLKKFEYNLKNLLEMGFTGSKRDVEYYKGWHTGWCEYSFFHDSLQRSANDRRRQEGQYSVG